MQQLSHSANSLCWHCLWRWHGFVQATSAQLHACCTGVIDFMSTATMYQFLPVKTVLSLIGCNCIFVCLVSFMWTSLWSPLCVWSKPSDHQSQGLRRMRRLLYSQKNPINDIDLLFKCATDNPGLVKNSSRACRPAAWSSNPNSFTGHCPILAFCDTLWTHSLTSPAKVPLCNISAPMVAVQHSNLKEADLFVAAECKHTDTQDTELAKHVLQRTFLGTDFLICCVACSQNYVNPRLIWSEFMVLSFWLPAHVQALFEAPVSSKWTGLTSKQNSASCCKQTWTIAHKLPHVFCCLALGDLRSVIYAVWWSGLSPTGWLRQLDDSWMPPVCLRQCKKYQPITCCSSRHLAAGVWHPWHGPAIQYNPYHLLKLTWVQWVRAEFGASLNHFAAMRIHRVWPPLDRRWEKDILLSVTLLAN